MDTDALKRKAFVSYVREDQETVMRLVEELRGAGVEVWWDKEGLRAQGGARWKKAIEKAIGDGDYFVACFSDAYWEKAAKSYMSIEIATAIERLRYAPPEARWFIPVRLANCPVPEYAISPDGAPEETLADLQWIDLWKDWDAGVREVIESILPRGPIPNDVQVELLRLKSPDPKARSWAVNALERIGSDAAVESIENALKDEDRDVRMGALLSLQMIGGAAAVEALTKALDHEDADLRWWAAGALGWIGSDAGIAFFANALNDEDRDVRTRAILALEGAGFRRDAAVEALTDALDHRHADVRSRAATSLWCIEDVRATWEELPDPPAG